MIKIIKGFLVSLGLILTILMGYEVYKVSPREFISDNFTFAYINENVKKEKFDDFLGFLEKEGYNIDRGKIKNIQKNIEGIYLFETSSFLNLNKDPAVVLDVGLKFPLYYFMINEYFNFTGKNYILKSKYRENLGLEEFGVDEIYMRPYRGNYVFAKNPQRIEEIIQERTAILDEGKEFLEKMDYGNLGIMFFNFKKERAYGLNNLSVVLNYEKNSLNIFSILSFKELNLDTPKNGYENRLEKYIGENSMYIRINDYVKAYEVSRRYMKRDKIIEFHVAYWQNVLGVDLESLLEDINQESVYNFQEKNGIIRFKKKERIDKIVQWVSYKNSLGFEGEMEREGDYLHFGEKRLVSKGDNFKKMKDNQIFYYNRDYEGKKMEFEVFNFNNLAKIQGKINDRVLSDTIKKIEEIARRDEK